MDYRQLLEDAAKFQKETNVRTVSLNLGELTPSQEIELVQELKLNPETSYGRSALYHYPKGDNVNFNVVFHYNVIAKEDEKIA